MKKYIKRDLEEKVLETLEADFIAAILGARQTGKTTLMAKLRDDFLKKGFLEDRVFSFNFDDVLLRQKIKADFYFIRNTIEARLNENLESLSSPIVIFIDEAQKVPEVFDLVKIIHDKFKKKVKIVLSGSASLEIQKKSAESLTGRISYLYLYPLSCGEILKDRFSLKVKNGFFTSLAKGEISYSFLKKQQALLIGNWERQREFEQVLKKAMLDGGLPAVWTKPLDKNRVYKSFTETYLEKDIRSLEEIGSLEDFTRLLEVFSLEIGSMLNFSNLSQASGLAVNTLKKYQSILVKSFVLNKLPPFLKKKRRTFVKSSKIYFFDVGIANFLAQREKYSHLVSSKTDGLVFENFLVKSFEAYNENLVRSCSLSFWRDYQGHEIDLVLARGEKLIPIEFTLADKVNSGKRSNFEYFFQNYPKAKTGFLVYTGGLEKTRIAGRPVFCLPWWLWW